VKKQAPDFAAILEVLIEHEVDFIVVGGVCAVLHGAPLTTFDLDIVHSRRPENIVRLTAALDSLGAYYRQQPERRLKPRRDQLTSAGHHLLMTDAGPLDLLGEIGQGQGFHDLGEQTVELEMDRGLRVNILNLETLIEMKERFGRDKDKAALPLLRRTLEEKKKFGK
jgi:hypothetical protein